MLFQGLRSTIGRGYMIDPDDVRRTKTALVRTGDYDPTRGGGVDATPDRGLFQAIETFQSREGLKVDGLMRPDGETDRALRQAGARAEGAKAGQPSPRRAAEDPGEAARESRLKQLAAANQKKYDAQRRQAAQNAQAEAAGPAKGAASDARPNDPRRRSTWEKRGWGGPRGAFRISRDEDFDARRRTVLADRPSVYEVNEKPTADDSEPWYALSRASEVEQLEEPIEATAEKFGVDPDLVKAVLHLETTQGWYDRLAAVVPGLENETIRPMNVHAAIWGELGYSREDLADPAKNIEAGVTLLRRLIDRVPNGDIGKVATLYNNLTATAVSDYGARVKAIYNEKPWRKRD